MHWQTVITKMREEKATLLARLDEINDKLPMEQPKESSKKGKQMKKLVKEREEEERKKYARMRAMNAAAADAAKAAGGDAGPGSLVEEKQIKLRDQGEFILILIPVRAIRMTARVFCLLYPHRQRGHRRNDTRRLRRRHQAHHGALLQSSPARFPREGTTAERTERARVRRPRQRSDGKFIFIHTWAIRLTICFVYRRLKIVY